MNPAIERKLNTIYDLLDSREFKKAYKQTQTCIQKMNHPVFYAAQALTLQRMGKVAEALETASSLKASPLEDRVTIEILTLIYRSLGMTKEAAEMYELLYQRQPAPETADALFSAYATDFEVEKQFVLSMRLIKSSDNHKYTLWGVLSLVLSVELGCNKPASLALADQMLSKLATKPGFQESEQTFRMQMAIQRIGGKTDKLLALLQSKGQVLDNPAELAELTAKCQCDLSQSVNALNTLLPLLQLNLRESSALSIWQLYRLFLETAVKLMPVGSFPAAWSGFGEFDGDCFGPFREGEDADLIGRKVLACLRKTQREIEGSSSFSRNIRRTGLLAELELYRLMWTEGRVNVEGEVIDAVNPIEAPLLAYLKQYFDIPSAPEDLLSFLRVLTKAQAERLSTALDQCEAAESPVVRMRQDICYSKVKRYLGTLSEDASLVLRWFQSYKDCAGIEPPPKKGEHRTGDEILLLASELLRSSAHPLQTELAVIMLLYGVQSSPYNFNLKIRLMEEWERLGYTAAALQLYLELDIKAIQHETLGHLIFAGLQESPHLGGELQTFCNKVEQFHRVAISDLADSISTAYTHYNYEGIKDFYDFKKKLGASKLKPTAELTSIYCKVIDKFQRIKEVSMLLKDSAPTLKRLISLSTDTVSLCDPACFYFCAPQILRVAGSGVSVPTDRFTKGYGPWSTAEYFKGFVGLAILAANCLNPEHDMFTGEELETAKTAIVTAGQEGEGKPLSGLFRICGTAFMLASAIIVAAKVNAAEGIAAGTTALEQLRVQHTEAVAQLATLNFPAFLKTYANLVHWPLVFSSLLYAAMKAIVPEPKKKKGKKATEEHAALLRLISLLKDFGTAITEMKDKTAQAVEAMRSASTGDENLREAFGTLACLAEVPEFLSEIQSRFLKERAAPINYLREWLAAFPVNRAPEPSS